MRTSAAALIAVESLHPVVGPKKKVGRLEGDSEADLASATFSCLRLALADLAAAAFPLVAPAVSDALLRLYQDMADFLAQLVQLADYLSDTFEELEEPILKFSAVEPDSELVLAENFAVEPVLDLKTFPEVSEKFYAAAEIASQTVDPEFRKACYLLTRT